LLLEEVVPALAFYIHPLQQRHRFQAAAVVVVAAAAALRLLRGMEVCRNVLWLIFTDDKLASIEEGCGVKKKFIIFFAEIVEYTPHILLENNKRINELQNEHLYFFCYLFNHPFYLLRC
jgi:hypothetical protein